MISRRKLSKSIAFAAVGFAINGCGKTRTSDGLSSGGSESVSENVAPTGLLLEPAEQEGIRFAGKCAAKTMDFIRSRVVAGVSGREIDGLVRDHFSELGVVATDKKDGWSVQTLDGSLSAEFKHTILMSEQGPEILTATLDGPKPGDTL